MKRKSTVTRTLQVGVKSLIVSPRGRALMLRTNTAAYKFKEAWWDIPGGRIRVEEDLLTGLLREIKEETGISRVTSVRLLDARDIFTPELHVVRLVYLSRVTSETVKLDGKEHVAHKWLSLKEMQAIKPIDPYLKAVLKDRSNMSFIKNFIDGRNRQ